MSGEIQPTASAADPYSAPPPRPPVEQDEEGGSSALSAVKDAAGSVAAAAGAVADAAASSARQGRCGWARLLGGPCCSGCCSARYNVINHSDTVAHRWCRRGRGGGSGRGCGGKERRRGGHGPGSQGRARHEYGRICQVGGCSFMTGCSKPLHTCTAACLLQLPAPALSCRCPPAWLL